MTVKIDLSVNAQAAEAQLKRIQDSLRRVAEEMKGFARAGADASKIDFSAQSEQIQKQYQAFLALNESLRRRIEMSGQSGLSPFDLDWNRLGYLNPQTQRENQRRTIDFSTRGTPFTPPPSGGGGGIEEGGGGGRGGMGGFIGGIAGGVWQGVKLGLGIFGIGSGISAVSGAFQDARSTGRVVDEFVRRTKTTSDSFSSVRDKMVALGDNLQLSNLESVKLALNFQRASNELDPEKARAGALGAAAFARGYGMAPETTTQAMGTMQLFNSGKGGMSPRQLATLTGRTIAEGMYGGKSEEVLEGMARHIEMFTTHTLKTATDTAPMMGVIAAMGSMRDKYPGFATPTTGFNLLEAATQGMRNPQGGLAGQILMQQTLQRAYPNKNAFEIKAMMQDVTSTSIFPSGKFAYQEYYQTALNNIGGEIPANLIAASNVGLTDTQGRALREAMDKFTSTPGMTRKYEAMLKAAGVKPEDVNIGGMNTLMGLVNASPEMLHQQGIKNKLPENLTDQELKNELVRLAAKEGMPRNEIIEAEQALKDATNKLESTIGTRLIDALVKLANLIEKIVNPIEALSNYFTPDKTLGKIVENPSAAIGEGYWGESREGNKDIPVMGGVFNVKPGSPADSVRKFFKNTFGGGETPSAAVKSNMSKSAFIQSMLPFATAAAEETGQSPEDIIAQSALETEWGKHAPGNNYFGIKAGKSWQGKTQSLMTTEVRKGALTKERAKFRAYDSMEESTQDYADLINTRYRNGLKGYATDPNYNSKLSAIKNQVNQYMPLPEEATSHSPNLTSALAQRNAELNINLYQHDSNGNRIGLPKQQKMDLSKKQPIGSMDVLQLFSPAPNL